MDFKANGLGAALFNPGNMAETNNIIDGILAEIDRVRELITEYESLPGGAGAFGAMMMKQSIERGKRAISSGDAIEALRAYADLQGHTG